jgi:hypothetical protein
MQLKAKKKYDQMIVAISPSATFISACVNSRTLQGRNEIVYCAEVGVLLSMVTNQHKQLLSLCYRVEYRLVGREKRR